jgi:hypothetical protein
VGGWGWGVCCGQEGRGEGGSLGVVWWGGGLND